MSDGLVGRVRAAFEENFTTRGEVGAAVSIWCGEVEAVSLWGGHTGSTRETEWGPETLVLIWSATKGLSSACVLHAMQGHRLRLEDRVAAVWPEFGQCGKEAITLGQILSHRAGLSALDDANLSILDHERVARAFERQVPLWDAAEGHGYGPRTYGVLIDEIVRRITSGVTLADYWRREFAEPLGLDTWIGLPPTEHHRVATILPARIGGCSEPDDAFSEAMAEPGSLTRRAFFTPAGVLGASAMNSPAIRAAAIPSYGGITTASSLARFYAMLACGGELGGRRYFREETLRWMTTPLAQGLDKVLHIETAFSAGYMLDPVDANGHKLRGLFGRSARAFGHPGAGGSLAFADPENRFSFAYVMNQMETGVLPKQKALALVEAVSASLNQSAIH